MEMVYMENLIQITFLDSLHPYLSQIQFDRYILEFIVSEVDWWCDSIRKKCHRWKFLQHLSRSILSSAAVSTKYSGPLQ